MACRILMISFALLCACSSDETGDAQTTDGSDGAGASGSSTTGASGTPASSGATSGSGASGGGGGDAAAGGGGMSAVGGAGSGGAVEPANDCEACFFESCAAEWTECQADPSGYCTIFLPMYYQCADQQGEGCCEAYETAGPPAVAMVDCWTAACASACPCP